MENKTALASTVCMTYNQAPYIKQCLDGFVMQQTKFPFVAIVVDDASTDNEPQVLWDFVNDELNLSQSQKEETDDYIRIVAKHKRNPNCLFVVLFLKYNHYSIQKSKYPYYKVWRETTKYYSICEGDDYWTDPLKLQKQVDYLEGHPECGLVYTNAMVFNQNKGILTKTTLPLQANFETLLFSSPIMTLTTCYRADIAYKYSLDIPKDETWQMGDLPLWLYIAAKSSIKYLSEITAIYRVLTNSVSHKNSFQQSIDFSLNSFDIRLFFAKKYNREKLIPKMAKAQINELFQIAISYNKNISFQIMKFALKYKVFDIKTWGKIIIFATKSGRNYHIRKYA